MTPLFLWLVISTTLIFLDPVHLQDISTCSCCNNTDIISCPAGRVTFRTDCLCCPVCARQTGEICDQVFQLCDTELKLICDKNATCQGVAELKSINITHNSTVIQWKHGNWDAILYGRDLHLRSNWTRKEVSSNDSLTIEGLEPNATYYFNLEGENNNTSEIIFVQTKNACDVNGTWLSEGESITEGCEQRCTCRPDGALNCTARCLHRPGSITDPLCTEVPSTDDVCCVEYTCAQIRDSSVPHLIVTGKGPANVSVAWDDFKPPSYERGYVLEVRVAGSEANRIQLQVNNTNMKTIEDLTPNTRYEVRVAILDDQDNLTSASEFINVTTTDGCVKNNTTYRVDDEWNEGCELKCTCRSNNTLECSERCVRPLYRADTVSSDAYCTPVPDKDTCCVSLRCEQDSDQSHAASQCPTPDDTHTDHCVSTCRTDSECSAHYEVCCPTSCGAKVCINASVTAVNESDPCLNVVCGPQAKCQFTDGLAVCQCNVGTIGNPNDYTQGCVPGVATSFGAGCSFKNSTHLPGESFFDGCEYRCLCNLNAEIECEPRCAPPAESLNDPTCQVISDPNDSCCNMTICGSHPIKDSSPKTVKIDSLEGCYYKNKTYQKLDTIQEGCSMKCTCQGHGSISCIPRCPPTASLSSGCVSLPDPIDSCCNVTICNITGLPDDLKANDLNTTEMGVKDNLVTDTTITKLTTTTEDQVTTTVTSAPLTTPTVNKIQNKGDSSKENYFPVPTKDAFNELGPTDAAKKGEGTAKAIRTIANMTQTTKLEETTLPALTTPDNLKFSHVMKDVTSEVSKTENSIGTSREKEVVVSDIEDVTEHSQTPEVTLSSTSTISLLFPKVDKKDRGRKLEDKVTGLNNDVFCELNGHQMSIGQESNDGCQRICKCQEGGKTSCTPITCSYTQPSQISGCLDWQYDHDFVPKPGNCCAEAVCLTKVPPQIGASCEYNGRTFTNFEPIPPSIVSSCDLECRCMNGNVSCESRCAPVPSHPPLTLNCLLNAEVLPLPHDTCCKAWQCPNLMMGNHEEDFDSFQGSLLPSLKEVQTTTTGKILAQNPFLLIPVTHEENSDVIFKTGLSSTNPEEDTAFPGYTNMQNYPISPAFSEKECQTADGPRAVGEQWEESPGCRSKRCICVLSSNGSTNVECSGGCYPIEKYLKPTAGCSLPVMVTPDDPCFCPFVMCNKTDPGSSVQNLTAVAINATSVRVSLVIPKLYVGLHGQVEVLYTDDATQTNTSTWNKEVFSHRNDLFAEAQMQHELNSLLPDTTYYIKADVILSGNSNTATSGVVTVRTPPLLVSTTSATTIPSRITFDPSFNITDKQAASLRISWRPLTEQEKNLVDGVQLKYRIQGDETWSLTTMIHRDVTSYVLRDLQPNTAYEVDMALTPVSGVSTEIETLNPITFQTNPIHDDYAFDLTLTVDKVLITSVNLHWSGVPFPMHKYVHLYIIKFKMEAQPDVQTVYKHPKVEQVTLEGLKPGNRYQIWMDAILSNGGVRKSNTVEIVTKPGVALKQPEKERLETSQTVSRPSTADSSGNNSYYEALIAVAVVAAICVLGFVALLVLLFRRQRSSTTAPSSTHKSQSAYENPTYKPSYDGELENGKTQA